MSRKNRNNSGATQVNEPKVTTPETEVSSESNGTETAATTTIETTEVTETTVGSEVTVDGADESTDDAVNADEVAQGTETATETNEAESTATETTPATPIDEINANLAALQVESVVVATPPVAEETPEVTGSEPALPVDQAVVNVDTRPLHIKLIEQWLIGDSPAEQAYVVAMAPGRTVGINQIFLHQQTLVTVIRYLLSLKGQEFFEGMDRWLEIVDEYSDGAFGPKYAMRGLNEKNAPFTAESANLLQRFLYLSQRIANKEARGFVLKQCVDTTVALNKMMDPDAREKLNAWLAQYE